MTGHPQQTETTRRRHAASSRERLVTAAARLFSERGYDRTTARDIGAAAGVDPAMIARYFGGKVQLYIASLAVGAGQIEPRPMLEPERMAALLQRGRRNTGGPIFQVVVRSHEDDGAQQATRAELHRRLVAPLTQRLTDDGVADPALRAEVIVAAFAGVVLGRESGAFDLLPEVGDEELLEILLPMLTPAT